MDAWIFDAQLGLAHLIWLLLCVAVVAVPIATAAIEGGTLAILRGTLLAGTGSLFLLRSDAAINMAAAQLLQDLPPQLTPMVMMGIFITLWMGAWAIVLPRIGACIANAQGLAMTLAWTGAAGGLIYIVVFVLGGLPGALARGLNENGQLGQADVRAHQQQLAAVREANGTAVCVRIGELQRGGGLGRQMLASASRWGLDAQADALSCAAKAKTLTLLQAKALITELDSSSVARRHRLTPIDWQREPTPPHQQIGLSQVRLADYFNAALWSPGQHIVRVLTELDLAVTLVLLGELGAALLWMLDLLLRRQQPPKSVGDELILGD
jgi:hypothetical protein